MSNKPAGLGWRILAAAALLFLLAGVKPAAAQTAGTILGVVNDPSGASVPNANVTLTSIERSDVRTTASGGDGAYRFSAVDPGHYNIKVEAQGFKTKTMTGLTLDVAEEAVANLTLEVGTSTQQVTVSGEVPVVNTTSSSLGGLVNDQQISELPLNGRNYSDLALLQPGITQTTHSGLGDAGIWFSSNGMNPRANNYTIDGTPILTQNGTGPAGMTGNTLGVDGIKEYRVVTNMFSAEYGLLMGSQIVIVSKGGSNQWHGDGFEYLRNSVLDARNYFDPLPSLIGGHRLPEFRRNNFGGAVGGPIKKDKTFFLLVYEGLRLQQGDTIQDTTMPAACHFWDTPNGPIIAGGGPIPAGTPVPAGATTTILRGPIAGATLAPTPVGLSSCGGANPGTAVAAVVQPWIGQFPFPNEPGATANYTFAGQTHARDDYAQIRIDHNFSASDTFFARFTFDDARDSTPYLGGNLQAVDTGTGYPQFFNVGPSRNQYVTFGENHIFTPTLLNSLRLSFSRTNYVNHFATPNTPLNPDFQLHDPVNCGQPGAPACIWSFVPGLFTGGFTPGSGVTALVPPGTFPNYHIQNTWTVGDDLFYTRDKHALKFGMMFNRFNDPNLQSKAIFGTITFSGICNTPTAGPTPSCPTGFLSGIPSSINVVTPGSSVALSPGSTLLAPPFKGNFLERNWWYNTLGFYFQDDWRAMKRLTLNLGVRYEFRTDITDSNGRVSALRSPLTSTEFTIGPIMTNPSYRNWSPRLGFAYDVFGTGQTAIRGGFGIYYDVANLGALLTQNPTGTLPWVANTTATWKAASGPVTLPLSCVSPCVGAIALSGAAVGRSLQNANYNAKSPHSLQFNLTLEQQLPKTIGVSLSYVGTRGINLWQAGEGNPVVPASVDANGNPLYNVAAGQAGCQNQVLTLGAPAPSVAPCRVNPYFGSSQLFSNFGESWYNGLQLVVTKRVTSGLSFQGAYTYSKSQDDTQGTRFNDDCGGNAGAPFADDPFNTKRSWALSCYDITHVMNLNMLYHLPNIKSTGVVSKFTNGWWFANIVSIQGGAPFTPIINTDRSFSGVITQSNIMHASVNSVASTVVFCNGSAVPASGVCLANQTTQVVNFIPFDKNKVITGNPRQWFNPLMFGEPPLGQLGDAPRNFLRQPGLGNWNVSLVKDTKVGWLGEAGSVQFRAEVFNVTNRANFQMLGISTTAASVFTGSTTVNSYTPVGGAPTPCVTASCPIQAPLATAGQITNTSTTSRQIQFALRLSF